MRQTLMRSALLATLIAAVAAGAAALAENIDPTDAGAQYAWGENVGWINAEPNVTGNPGVTVSGSDITGFMWGENIGWINMSCLNNSTCGAVDYGVVNDGDGNLSGYAWGENVGWISFSCQNQGTCGTASYGVTIDPITGQWGGYAWGENIGWINFQHNQAANRVVSSDGDTDVFPNDNCPFDFNEDQVNTDANNTGINFPGADLRGNACDTDDDGDGCSDAEEIQLGVGTEAFGGRRDPLDVWDFYDVTDDQRVDLSDTLEVLAHFGHAPDADAMDNRLDREVPGGNEIWQTAEDSSGFGIDLTDALVSLDSFGHDCTAAPN